MKKLKYQHPFGAHDWVQAVIAACLIGGLAFAIVTRQHLTGFLLSLFLPPVIAAIILLYRFQRLTDEERSLTANAKAPVWEPVSPETLYTIRTDARLHDDAFWQKADETAESAVISVHHHYDVTHKIRYRTLPTRIITEHLLVCYLPDGRYILTAPFGCENAENIRLVRFRGKFLCTENKVKE